LTRAKASISTFSLNAPLLAQSWNDIAGVIRDQNSIPGNMRELFVRTFLNLMDPNIEDLTCSVYRFCVLVF